MSRIQLAGGWALEIVPDNPWEEPERLSKFCLKHRRYSYPFEQPTEEQVADGQLITLPVYMYDHSARVYAHTPFSCPWDSGKLGVQWVEQKVFEEWAARQSCPCTVEDLLGHELERQTAYWEGEVYGVGLYNPQGKLAEYGTDFYNPTKFERQKLGIGTLEEQARAWAASELPDCDEVLEALGSVIDHAEK